MSFLIEKGGGATAWLFLLTGQWTGGSQGGPPVLLPPPSLLSSQTEFLAGIQLPFPLIPGWDRGSLTRPTDFPGADLSEDRIHPTQEPTMDQLCKESNYLEFELPQKPGSSPRPG